jgi:hypothetical protein
MWPAPRKVAGLAAWGGVVVGGLIYLVQVRAAGPFFFFDSVRCVRDVRLHDQRRRAGGG